MLATTLVAARRVRAFLMPLNAVLVVFPAWLSTTNNALCGEKYGGGEIVDLFGWIW